MVDLRVTYMQLLRRPGDAVPASAAGPVAIGPERPAVDDYLALYAAVGGPVQWDQRSRMPLPELQRLIARDSTMLFVLRLAAQPVGMCEFIDADGSDIELANFGLIPAAQGKGLGAHFLNVALRAVWSRSTKRIWLRTDSNDHPRAVPTYERAGFKVYARTVESFPDCRRPNEPGWAGLFTPPSSAACAWR